MIILNKENFSKMQQELTLNWNEKMSFNTQIDGHVLNIDAADEFGGQNKGPRPKQFLLLALAGCTAMDVVSLLNKMRIEFKDFKIIVNGTLSDEHPKKYTAISLVYKVFGKNINIENVNKAVFLSKDKYCGVWATLSDAVIIDYIVEIVEA
jgi:putative redox protein